MKTIFAFLLLCTSSQAALLSSLVVPSTSSSLVFGVVPVGGFGSSYSVASAVSEVEYHVPLSSVQLMSLLVNDPGPYTAHGPLRVTANSWVGDYSTLAINGSSSGIAGCCAIIDGKPNVLTTQWSDVTLTRSGSTMRVNIMSADVPELSASRLAVVFAFVAATAWIRVFFRRR